MGIPRAFLIRIMPEATDEWPVATTLMSNLSGLQLQVQIFAGALALWDLCDPSGPNPAIPSENVNSIRLIGGSQGAMTIYNIAMLLGAIRKTVPQAPSILSRVDTEALKNAVKALKAAFPQFEPIRNAAAHPGELFSTPEKAQKNTPRGAFETPLGKMVNDGGVISIAGSFYNRTYFSTINGEVVTYDLSDRSLAAVEGVADMVYSAFSAFS